MSFIPSLASYPGHVGKVWPGYEANSMSFIPSLASYPGHVGKVWPGYEAIPSLDPRPF